jgi:hypothetical protein
MRRVIRKRIRRTEDGLDLAVDFNADIAINVGGSRPRPVDEQDGERDRAAERPDATDGNDEEGSRR